MTRGHVILVTFPAQGHINPALHFTRRLLDLGIDVTFTTSVSAHRRMSKPSSTPKGLSFATFSDGYDDGFKAGEMDINRYMNEVRTQGSRTVRDLLRDSSSQGRPVTCVVYSILLPWVSHVARELHVPSVLLWIQPASVMDIYCYYFNGHEDEFSGFPDDPAREIRVPGIPFPLSKQDVPSFLVPSSASDMYDFILPTLREQLDALLQHCDEEKPKVLANTFDALESDAMKAIERYEVIGVGPLIPSAFLDDDNKDTSNKSSSLGGDLFKKSSDDYIEWMNTQPKSSVVYVSFGSILTPPKPQMEEIARGLLESNRPFLWVIRETQHHETEKDQEAVENKEEVVSCLDELKRLGRIVPWCSQIEVLKHESLGCFVTHCGWNSTLESISCGVPVVAFPHWTDQGTNAKLIEDLWKTGVRVRVDGEKGMVESGEIRRCIEEVMVSEELRANANKWKALAREAAMESGSSTKNLKAFLEQVGGEYSN